MTFLTLCFAQIGFAQPMNHLIGKTIRFGKSVRISNHSHGVKSQFRMIHGYAYKNVCPKQPKPYPHWECLSEVTCDVVLKKPLLPGESIEFNSYLMPAFNEKFRVSSVDTKKENGKPVINIRVQSDSISMFKCLKTASYDSANYSFLHVYNVEYVDMLTLRDLNAAHGYSNEEDAWGDREKFWPWTIRLFERMD